MTHGGAVFPLIGHGTGRKPKIARTPLPRRRPDDRLLTLRRRPGPPGSVV